MGALFFEDVLGAGGFIVAFRMNRDKNAAFLDFSFVTLGFILRNAEADQSAGESADSGSDGSAAEGGHDWPSGNKGAQTRYGQRADPSQQPDRAPYDPSSASPDGRTFGHLCFL